MARKNLFATDSPVPPSAPTASPANPLASSRPLLGLERAIKEGPIGAISNSLESINAKAKRAEEIEKQLTRGQTIIELDPNQVEPSFVRDRMVYSAEQHAKLVEAIRDQGQLSPILVRPHPSEPARYQAAFGHRRLRAVAELGLKVRAVVRDLSDEELVIAQGQENNERTDLSFIEKVRFAAALDARMFRREIIMSALSTDKSDLSRMLSLASRLPSDLIDTVGPAPSVGRRRWLELADLLEAKDIVDYKTILSTPEFVERDTDGRFEFLFNRLRPKAMNQRSAPWIAPDGGRVARFTKGNRQFSLVIDERAAPEFGDFLLAKLDELYAEFKQGRDR